MRTPSDLSLATGIDPPAQRHLQSALLRWRRLATVFPPRPGLTDGPASSWRRPRSEVRCARSANSASVVCENAFSLTCSPSRRYANHPIEGLLEAPGHQQVLLGHLDQAGPANVRPQWPKAGQIWGGRCLSEHRHPVPDHLPDRIGHRGPGHRRCDVVRPFVPQQVTDRAEGRHAQSVVSASARPGSRVTAHRSPVGARALPWPAAGRTGSAARCRSWRTSS